MVYAEEIGGGGDCQELILINWCVYEATTSSGMGV